MTDKELNSLVKNGYDFSPREVQNNIPVLAAVSLSAKKDLSSLSYEEIIKAYEKEIDLLQDAAMKVYPERY